MPIVPIITFKAGICDLDTSSTPNRVHPKPTPGYIYLYPEDELIRFCWRPRDVPVDEPGLDLVMIPTDGRFVPYEKSPQPAGKPNGRIFVLKFTSSSQRHLFWLQSKPQGRTGNPAWFSPRDRKIGEIVDRLLQGEEVDVNRELAAVRNDSNNDDEDRRRDDDETMEDVEGTGDPHAHHEGGGGGAGPDATGGDFRSEGEPSREGGADGARAASSDAAAVVRNFLQSLGGQNITSNQARGKLYPLLTDLLDTNHTVPMIDNASVCTDDFVENLLNFLPPTVFSLPGPGKKEPSEDAVSAARKAMTSAQKRALLKKVVRSPQLHQSLASMSMALRDGGLPSISEALGIKVQNGGLVPGGTMPLGGGDAVEAFINGAKQSVTDMMGGQ